MPTHLEGLNGIVNGPFQGVNPHITRDPSWGQGVSEFALIQDGNADAKK